MRKYTIGSYLIFAYLLILSNLNLSSSHLGVDSFHFSFNHIAIQKIDNLDLKIQNIKSVTKATATKAQVITNFQADAKPQATTASISSNNSISIGGKTLPIESAVVEGENFKDPGSVVRVYNRRFLFAHNTNNLFGNLKNLNLNDTFTVNLNGKIKTYKVAKKIIITKSDAEKYKTEIYTASFGGDFDLSLMTCAGTMIGNNDASHRLIIEATEV